MRDFLAVEAEDFLVFAGFYGFVVRLGDGPALVGGERVVIGEGEVVEDARGLEVLPFFEVFCVSDFDGVEFFGVDAL